MIRIRDNKKGQVAIWFIAAFVIVALIMIVFFVSKKPVTGGVDETNPEAIIEKCARESINEAVDKMIPQGGFIEPENYKMYNNIKVAYLCQNVGYFKTCINQHPLLLNEMKEEILKYAEPRIEQCFLNMKKELEKRRNAVELGDMNISVSFSSNRVFLDIERKITITHNNEKKNFEKYNIEVNNPLYDLGKVAIEIASQEAKYCYFEYVGYMILYPRFSIEKFAMSDSTKIYTIKDKYSDKEMNIATRSCAIPPGI